MLDKDIFLLDMDGPLANFDLALYELCLSLKFDLDILGLDDAKRQYYMTENVIDQEHKKAIRSIINKSNWFRHLPVTNGAKEGVEELTEYFDVWVCTKPLDENISCRKDKMHWIKQNFPSLFSKVIMAPQKHLVRGSILLDDAPDLGYIHKASWTPVVFADTFNGPASNWGFLNRWAWGDDINILIEIAEKTRA